MDYQGAFGDPTWVKLRWGQMTFFVNIARRGEEALCGLYVQLVGLFPGQRKTWLWRDHIYNVVSDEARTLYSLQKSENPVP